MTALKKEDLHPLDRNPHQGSELFLQFKTSAEAIGAKVYYCDDEFSVKMCIWQILRGIKAKKVVLAKSPVIDALSSDTGNEVVFSCDDILNNAANADAGISEVDHAISETGSICQDASDVSKRLVSSLPPVHIALVRENKILKNFSDSLGLVSSSGYSNTGGYYSYISGPSRTSDIERVLTIGVHGPEELHIIVMAETY